MKSALCFIGFMVALFLSQTTLAVPSLQNVLEREGYAVPAADVVMAWNEESANGDGIVYGVRIAPRNGDGSFDLYYDESGALLTDADRVRLGVPTKDWSWHSVTQPGEWPLAGKSAAPAPYQPKSAGMTPEMISLEVPDVQTALLEDESGVSSPDKGALRIGLLNPLNVPITISPDSAFAGTWNNTPDGGRVWALTLSSAGAEGLRIHCTPAQFGPDASLTVYPAGHPEEACAPVFSTEAVWMPTCFSDSITLEWALPPDATGTGSQKPTLEIDAIAYQYRKLDGLMKSADACNIDLPCHSDWMDTGSAVGGIGSIGSTGMLWCTGTLLSDEDPATNLPFFLTANHCVASQGEANSLEVYWLYQQSQCGGEIPDPTLVSRTTGGADYLAGSPASYGTDVALLRLRGVIPATIPQAGYSTAIWPTGSDVTCIHHPSGDYKRISFGAKVNSGSPTEQGGHLEPVDRFHEILWNIDGGTTEAGSSGSPLFIQTPSGDHLIVGQLYGGYAGCFAKNEPDYFGRFDKSYPLLARFLAAPAPGEGEGEGEWEGEGETPVVIEGEIIAEGEDWVEGEVLPEGEGESQSLTDFQALLIKHFDSFDLNGDGWLSLVEVRMGIGAVIDDLFEATDTDHDGLLSEKELGIAISTGDGEENVVPTDYGCFQMEKSAPAKASPADMAGLALFLVTLVAGRGRISKP